MTAHTHTTLADDCYRCDLNKDEVNGMREDLAPRVRQLIQDIERAIYKAPPRETVRDRGGA